MSDTLTSPVPGLALTVRAPMLGPAYHLQRMLAPPLYEVAGVMVIHFCIFAHSGLHNLHEASLNACAVALVSGAR